MNSQNVKRQLLSEVLVGNVEGLRQYQQQTRSQNSPFRWLVSDTTTGHCYGVLPDGSQQDLTVSELGQHPQTKIWHVASFTNGLQVPECDEV